MRRLALALVLLSCRDKSTTVESAPPSATAVTSATAPAVDAGPAKKVIPPPAMGVEQWKVAHIKHDTKALEGIYAARVQFYGQSLTNKQCVEAKRTAVAKSPD